MNKRLNCRSPNTVNSHLRVIVDYLGLDEKEAVLLKYRKPAEFEPEVDNCHFNCWAAWDHSGGAIQHGWILSQDLSNDFSEAIFHSVLRRENGTLVDITPRKDSEKRLLFVPDQRRQVVLTQYNGFPAKPEQRGRRRLPCCLLRHTSRLNLSARPPTGRTMRELHKLPIAATALAIACTSFGVDAADIYKCDEGGRTVYQDTPCREGMVAPVKTSSAPVGPSASLASIQQRIQSLLAQSRALDAGHSRDLDALRRRLAGSTDAQLNRAEVDHVNAKWLPRIRETDRQLEALASELRRRCPGGASLNSTSQTCNK